MTGYKLSGKMSADTKGLRFHDKVAIVTGGCQGIGKGCVDVLGTVVCFKKIIVVIVSYS